ncbi:hypothetical protein CDL15_Pgr007359 [Punica granatum]|uniref:Uncharacterized protein n=1 Tax=Punica granatum TaxID=22663 RepID=A0A218X9X5_PUNGR|nr:hypothetical protein CDL15_Pgr007359 [Punica granatum]
MESIRVDIVNTEDKGASMVMIDGVQGDRHSTKISLREYDKNDNVGELVEAHGITHPNLIRSYVFNLQARTVLCEPNVVPLSQWVKHNHRMLNTSLQRPYHGAVLYICDDVKRIIRGLLHLLIYIHEEKRLYARKFTMDNVVVVEGEAKFANLQLYKLAGSSTLQERAKTNDFDCLGKILGQMFGKRSLPRDMTKFIAALGDPQIRNRYKLLQVHVALQNLQEYMGTIVDLVQNRKYLDQNDEQAYFSVTYSTSNPFSLLRFLRNVVTHLPEQLVQKNVQFVSDDISLAILNHYPDFVVDVQRKLHDRDDSLLGKLSYLEMDKLFRIYVYRGGEPPMFHYGPCKSIYSTKGLFVSETEKGNIYLTTDPDEALVSFLLFSIIMMVEYLYKHGSHEIKTP